MDEMKGRVVLVTGGAGFLGSTLCRRLVNREGARVICFDNLLTGKVSNIEDLLVHPSFVFVKGDCNIREDLWRVFLHERPDFVFHYAAVVGVKRTVEHPLMVLNDLTGIRNVFELAALSGSTKVVFSSSSEAYGEPVEIPEREDGVLNAKFPYALVKLIGEQYGQAMATEFGLRATALRFFNVYGPGQEASDYGFVVGIFTRQVLAGLPPTIFGDGMQTRDFVFVEDNIEVAIRSMLSKEADGQVINVGSGNQTTVKDLAEKIIEISGKKDLSPSYLPSRAHGEIRHRCPDVAKCRSLIGYVPETDLRTGLLKTYAWYQERDATKNASVIGTI